LEQIKDAIERLVSLIHGEEGHDTRGEQLEELVSATSGAADVQDPGELDVIEV